MKIFLHHFLITTLFFLCGQGQNFKSRETSTQQSLKQNNVYTKYEYIDALGKSVSIENSYPKGGQSYTHPCRDHYIYAVFWTRIINNTSETLELTIEFLEKSYQLSSSPDIIFKLLIPSDAFTLDKETLTNYGLDLNKYLDSNLHSPIKYRRKISPNDSSGFYIVTLFNRGVKGTLRTELKINEGKLSYRVNDRTVDCGEINLKQLKLKK